MFTDKLKSPFGATVLTLILVFMTGLIAIGMEKPVGSLSGRIALAEKGYGLSTHDIPGKKVYAIAVGPRGGQIQERGVWIKSDGTFEIAQLPVGEYSLRLRAPGFSSYSQDGIFIDEAKRTKLGHEITLQIAQPSVNIASNSRVFTTHEPPHFWLNASGSEKAVVRIYRKDILALISQSGRKGGLEFSSDLNLYKPYGEEAQPLPFAAEKPVQILKRDLVTDTEDWAHAEFKLNKPLPPGEYVALAEVRNLKNDRDWNMMWFSVSDLGLVIKHAPEKTVVRAIDLNTLKPVPNAAISLLDRNKPGVNQNLGKTNVDGFVELPGMKTSGESYQMLVLGQDGANRAFGGSEFWGENTADYKTYFYTERPIYRLGQTVFYKGISRILGANGFTTPKAGLGLNVTIEDPDNNKLWEGKLATSAHGTFHGTWQVPADGKTGAYQITFRYPNGTESYQRFEVAEYRKPEYQVEVLPLESRIIAGGKAKARIRATYYFGAPVANARIKYSIYADTDWSSRYELMPRPDYYGYYDDWASEDEGYEDASYAGNFITEGYAQTDDAGEAVIEFDTPAPQVSKDNPYSDDYMDKRYTVQAEVTDLSRIAVVGSGVQKVSAGDFTLFVEPDNWVLRAGEPVQANVTAVDYQGKPVANQNVSVTLTRWKWDQATDDYRGTETFGTANVTTDAQGRAKVTLPTTDKLYTDSYYISAQSSDRGGHTVYDQTSVWVASENYPYIRDGQAAKQEAFSIKLDKPVYQPGDTARVMITAPVTGKEQEDVLIAVEGSKLHRYFTVPMNATAKMVEIPLIADYAPNVYVTATLVGAKHQFYNQSEMVKVSPEQHFLKIAVSTDKPKYKPGETAIYTLKATDKQGKPVPNTELSLGVVDESIYAIRPEAAKDIAKFFYNKRENSVSTLSSFPEEYSGGPDKVEPRVRKDFRDVAAWLPDLITDSHGLATAKVKLPDNLTTWRATVRGIDMETDVGATVSKVIATQDLIVRLALPRFYTQYDEARLTAIVHNYTDKAQRIAVTLSPSSQFNTNEGLVHTLTVQPDKAERTEWPVTVNTPGEGTVAVKAIGDTEGDALELKVPIRPLGIEMTQSAGGVLTADPASADIPLKLPPGLTPDQAKDRFAVSASPIGPVMGSFDSLIDYPYGCTEQTMSRLYPSIIAVRLNQKLAVPLSDEARKKFDQVAVKALARLSGYHHGDGGWGWWEFDESNPYLTAYVMEGLYLLEKSGRDVDAALPSGWRQDGLNWLNAHSEELAKQLADPKLATERPWQMDNLIDLAYMQYVLSLYGQKPNAKTRTAILARVGDAPPEALAYLTMAFRNRDDGKAASLAYGRLNQLADPADGMRNWDRTLRMQKLLRLQWPDYSYRFTGTEATALGLRASVAMGAPDAQLDAIERWLMLERGKGHPLEDEQASQAAGSWDNTKTTAQVLQALMEKALVQGKPADTNMTVNSNLWKEALNFTIENLYAPEHLDALTAAVPGQSIHLEKLGLGRLYYSNLLSYLQPLKPGDMVSQQPLPEGLKIRRAFYRLHAEPVGPEGTLRFKTQPLGGDVRSGETLLMKIIVDTPVALPYVMIDAALPSGGEVVSSDPRVGATEATTGDDSMNGDWGDWWWSHQDILDDRIVLFATSLPAGKSELHALVRMELPGTFQMNPVRLEGMYSRGVRAYSALDSLKVVE